jgi:hypothetical protein
MLAAAAARYGIRTDLTRGTEVADGASANPGITLILAASQDTLREPDGGRNAHQMPGMRGGEC